MAFIATSSSLPIPAVGASGAIAGVMAASLVIWPRAHLKAPGALLLLFTLSIVYSILQAIGVPTLFMGGPVLFILGCLMMVFFARQGGSFLVALFRGVQVPAWFVLGLFLGIQLWSGTLALVNPAYGGSVGWWAHIGGFASGLVCAAVFPKHPIVLKPRPLLGA